MKPFESNVSSAYGAPMGRRSDKMSGECYLQKVPFVDGDYDPGGAYWGGGSKDGAVWCAWSSCKAIRGLHVCGVSGDLFGSLL